VTFSCTLCALLSGVTRNSRAPGQISKSSPLSTFPTVLPLYTFTALSPLLRSHPSLPLHVASQCIVEFCMRMEIRAHGLLTITPGLFAIKLRPAHFRPTVPLPRRLCKENKCWGGALQGIVSVWCIYWSQSRALQNG